ncbi:MAG TPA: ABC transporter substrate-binding protein [Chloroflexota bacterium]|nr:ABC transporter substrate-binding protein [Chloroflexota bacterium]
MPKNLELTIACRAYDRIAALRDGSVQPEGIDLRIIPLVVEETFWRQLHHVEFDASELSFSSYTISRSRGELPLLAIPVFPSRYFRHSCVFVNPDRIKRPEDMKGKRIGVPEYQMTAAVWIRGMLADDYGVQPRDVEWFSGGVMQPGREEKLPLHLPSHTSLTPVKDRSLNDMLLSGDLDGYIGARVPGAYDEGKLVRLFPDYEQVEMDYYRRTRVFPIMHVLAIKESILERNPWVAMSLYKAFREAKDNCLEEMADSSALQYALPWMWPSLERARSAMGPDIWPYGVEASRPTLDKFVEYMDAQGLSERPMKVEELFAPSTLDEFKI